VSSLNAQQAVVEVEAQLFRVLDALSYSLLIALYNPDRIANVDQAGLQQGQRDEGPVSPTRRSG
jgi:hypothetical protein